MIKLYQGILSGRTAPGRETVEENVRGWHALRQGMSVDCAAEKSFALVWWVPNSSCQKHSVFEWIISRNRHGGWPLCLQAYIGRVITGQTYPLRSRSRLSLRSRSFSPLSRNEASRFRVLPLFFFTSFTRIVLPPRICSALTILLNAG
jgi:hypothetical protein